MAPPKNPKAPESKPTTTSSSAAKVVTTATKPKTPAANTLVKASSPANAKDSATKAKAAEANTTTTKSKAPGAGTAAKSATAGVINTVAIVNKATERSTTTKTKPGEADTSTTKSKAAVRKDRAEAAAICENLSAFVYNHNKPGNVRGYNFTLDNTSFKIATWFREGKTQSRRLWAEFSYHHDYHELMRTAALGAISVANRNKLSFISYIHPSPFTSGSGAGLTLQEAGLLSMMYSLLLQLLQFKPENDEFKIESEVLTGLKECMEGWTAALKLVEMLLAQTPDVRYCIIDGIVAVENLASSNADRCKELLEVLFAHSKRPETTFSIFLTASGQSRILKNFFELEEHTYFPNMKEMTQGGRKFEEMKF